ncbi:MAG: tyrosine-type recombinase/integrase [Flavobacteriaceae bacterium]
MVKVRLRGLNKRQARGKWYVSIRATGETVVKGFDGTAAELQAHLESEGFLTSYATALRRNRVRAPVPGSLGDLVDWYMSGDVDRWNRLDERTRQDYSKALNDLSQDDRDMFLDDLEPADLYDLRDNVAKIKWPKRADQLMAALSGAMSEGVKRRKMRRNIAKGIEKIHVADGDANREWPEKDVATAIERAPRHLLIPLLLARFAGLRGGEAAALPRTAYQKHPAYGRTIRFRANKNRKSKTGGYRFMIVPPILADALDLALVDSASTMICLHSAGLPWKSAKSLQKAMSVYLTGLAEAGQIEKGLTLHGLRTIFAADLRRQGVDLSDVQPALGHASPSQTAHYTRHVEIELAVARAFGMNKKAP